MLLILLLTPRFRQHLLVIYFRGQSQKSDVAYATNCCQSYFQLHVLGNAFSLSICEVKDKNMMSLRQPIAVDPTSNSTFKAMPFRYRFARSKSKIRHRLGNQLLFILLPTPRLRQHLFVIVLRGQRQKYNIA